MKNKKAVWLSKLAVITLCTAMAAEPAAIYAGSFTDGTAPAICEEEPQIQPPAIYEENPQIQQPAGEDFAPDGEESPEDSFSAGDEWDDEWDDDYDDSDNLDPGVLLGGPCGDNATWSLQYGILTLEGTGKVEGWYTLHDWFTGELIEKRESPWKDYSSGIKEVHVGDGITGLGQFMFGNLPNLKKAVFADSVKVIDNTIFANDKLLTDIILGNGLEEIGDDAFFGTGVTKLVLPSSRNLQGSDPMRYE